MSGSDPDFSQAQRLFEAGEYSSAVNSFEQAARTKEPGADQLVTWARALVYDGRPTAAAAQLERALAKNRACREAYLLGAQLLNARGEPEMALSTYERGSLVLEDDMELFLEWGRQLGSCRRPEQARWRFERALVLDRRCLPAYIGAGNCLLTLGLPEEAGERFKYAVEQLDPESGEALSGWGRACVETGDLDVALEKLERARTVDAGKEVAAERLLDVGRTLVVLERHSEASEVLQEAIEQGSKIEAPPNLKYDIRVAALQASFGSKRFDHALVHCNEALSILSGTGLDRSPAGAWLYYMQGGANTLLKLYRDAITSFRQAGERSNETAIHAVSAVASIFAAQGKYAEAWAELRHLDTQRPLVERLKLVSPDDPQLLAYGTALLWLDRFETAKGILEGIVAARPRSAGGWAKLVELHLEWAAQDKEKAPQRRWEAYEAYRKALPPLEARLQEERSSESLAGLARLHLRMDELDLAEPLFREAVDLDRESSDALAGLAIVLVKRSDHRTAIEYFEKALTREPDNLAVQCHLADAYTRISRGDVALELYYDVLRIAPGNVGAHIGAGEILLQQGEESKDDSLYEDAEVHFSSAVRLARSVRSGLRQEGSTGLGVRHWADLHYARGYVRVKIYEARTSEIVGHAPKAAREKLEGALDDFETARRTGVNSHTAERSQDRVRERLKRLSTTKFTESYPPFIIAICSLTILVALQLFFFADKGFSKRIDSTSYAVLTSALLVMSAAGFYLPQVLN